MSSDKDWAGNKRSTYMNEKFEDYGMSADAHDLFGGKGFKGAPIIK